MENQSPPEYLRALQAYWRQTHTAYLEHLGTTFQSGLVTEGNEADPILRSNLYMAAAAGIKTGDFVLDAGCGVCGPAIDIASHLPGVRIAGLTVSPEQARTAHERAAAAGVDRRVSVQLADYHRIPFANEVFHVVMYLECTGYSYDLERMFAEAFRTTKPGGHIYIKDVLRKGHEFSAEDTARVAEFDRSFTLYRTPSLPELAGTAEAAGYHLIETRDLSSVISTGHALESMVQFRDGLLEPTLLGRLHYPICSSPSVLHYGELRAIKPFGG
jgi:ubiquinone/menaquinone biosynthesis C-methylase UbiE